MPQALLNYIHIYLSGNRKHVTLREAESGIVEGRYLPSLQTNTKL